MAADGCATLPHQTEPRGTRSATNDARRAPTSVFRSGEAIIFGTSTIVVDSHPSTLINLLLHEARLSALLRVYRPSVRRSRPALTIQVIPANKLPKHRT